MNLNLGIVFVDVDADPGHVADLIGDNTLIVVDMERRPLGILTPDALSDVVHRQIGLAEVEYVTPSVHMLETAGGDEAEVEEYAFDALDVERAGSSLSVRVGDRGAHLLFDSQLAGSTVTPPTYYACRPFGHDNWVQVYVQGMDCEDLNPYVHPLR